jgi:hypothetical protein
MADAHLIDDAQIDAYLDAQVRDPAVLVHVRGCDDCLAKVRAARRERVLVRAALESTRVDADHLDADTVAAFCDEQLDDDTTREVATHVARCGACLEHYLDLVTALTPEPSPVGATAARESSAASRPAVAATGPSASPPLVPSIGTFGTVFVTRFANELRLTFVEAPARLRPSAWASGQARSGAPRAYRDEPEQSMFLRARRSAPRTARVELRSRSFSTFLRERAPTRRAPIPPPRPSVRLELPGIVATLELVDLHDGNVELEIHALPTRRRGGALRLTVAAPGHDETRLALDAATPTPLGPIATPATLTFDDDDGAPTRVELRNLVTREPTA